MVFFLACTDYAFSTGKVVDAAAPVDTAPEVDTGRTVPDSPGDSDPPDSAPPDSAPPDSGDSGSDGCYEPEDGYASNPAARIFTTDGVTPTVVTLVLSDTSYHDVLYLDSPVTVALADAATDPIGTTVSLGPYAADTELIFGIIPQDTGDHWQSGPASRNADGVEHVAVTYEGGCSWLIGFEDLYGGGDRDYNDVVLRVQGMLRQED